MLDWMAKPEEDGGGGRRAEWIDGGDKTVVWVWWRRPEEWAGLLADWVCSILSLLDGCSVLEWAANSGVG